jgi:ABC-2 type transport system permease protein
MTRPGTIRWFALNEARFAWRDWVSLMTGGNRRRMRIVVLGFAAYAVFMHGLAWLIVAPSADVVAAGDKNALIIITSTLILSGSLMLSQAMESVTRAFYSRGDMELILTSPAAMERLFAVRIAGIAVTVVVMGLVVAAPFIDVMIWLGGARWAAAYAVDVAVAMDAVVVALGVVFALFRAIGPKRARLVAQVAAALIGAGFAIGVQSAAIVSFGTITRMTGAPLAMLNAFAPDPDSAVWWPARAVLGQLPPLAGLCGLSLVALAISIRVVAPRVGQFALAVASVPPSTIRHAGRRTRFRTSSPARALRRKEWTLLARDPWLISQTLMQLLYLVPAALLVWRNFRGADVSTLIVPILIVAAGQLGGGLAWLAVSGEDAPDLIASAPVSAARVLRAKTEAVVGGTALIFAPFIVALSFTVPFAAVVALGGVIVASGSSMAIQWWFRAQAKRSLFRRRQTSSRIATFAEALSSTGWAGTGALATAGTWLAAVPAVVVLTIVAAAWLISPAKRPRAKNRRQRAMPTAPAGTS